MCIDFLVFATTACSTLDGFLYRKCAHLECKVQGPRKQSSLEVGLRISIQRLVNCFLCKIEKLWIPYCAELAFADRLCVGAVSEGDVAGKKERLALFHLIDELLLRCRRIHFRGRKWQSARREVFTNLLQDRNSLDLLDVLHLADDVLSVSVQ